MRAFLVATLASLALFPAACSESEDAPGGEAQPERGEANASEAIPDASADALVGATPNDERVATLGLLNKRNNLSEDIQLSPGESIEVGPVILRLATCERTPPWEMPQETGAFVQVDVLERGQSEHSRIFSGWLFKQSPSLNVVEHPIYDVWVKECAMRFPGEDASGDSEG
ncbi:MAG: DUF2155 domain-containing protein [Erythrobacter sp.]|uniref:DUF2155 domain-containing protein n=1 Tax=Erythrobacter sp. TaxID=1042 RepID=UPI0032EF2119